MSGGQLGHHHEAGFYESDEQFRDLIVPFVEGAVAAGEPVIIGYDERKADLLRGWLAEPAKVDFSAPSSLYATPARAIAAYRRSFEEHVAAGATRINIAGDVPHEGNGGSFDGWDRYESAVNTVWDDFPVRSLCLYDSTSVSGRVRDVVERTHPHLIDSAGVRRSNERYEHPASFIGLPVAPDHPQSSAPTVKLTNPTPARARRGVLDAASGSISDRIVEDLQFAVSEAVANGLVHGVAPVTVRIWASDGQVTVHVHDLGPGPANYLAGMVALPPSGPGAGLGLWIAHQLDIDIAFIRAPDGFTVRLRARSRGTEGATMR